MLAAWIRTELRSEEPLVDMAMMRIHGVWTTNLVAFLVGVGMYSSFILLPQFVQEPKSTGYGFGVSVVASGLSCFPRRSCWCWSASSPAASSGGSAPSRAAGGSRLRGGRVPGAGRRPLAAVGGLRRLRPAGRGIGLAFGALANLIVENVRQDQTGVATGMNTVMRTIGGALGGQIAATLLAGHRGPTASRPPTPTGWPSACARPRWSSGSRWAR